MYGTLLIKRIFTLKRKVPVLLLYLFLLLSCSQKSSAIVGGNFAASYGESQDEATQESVETFFSSIDELEAPVELEDKFSYAYGNLFASSLAQNGADIDLEYFVRGVLDYYGTPYFSEAELQQIFSDYQTAQLNAAEARYEAKKSANLAAAEDFLKVNATRSYVNTTKSGLQYEIVKKGSGPVPSIDDSVLVDYSITLLNGVVADSSYDRGEPVVLEISKMMKGVKEGLMLMSVGSKYRFWIHPSLAYGENGISIIGPNELIIFEVELYEIEQ